MTYRSLCLVLAASGVALFAGTPAPSMAAPGPVIAPAHDVELVQQVDYYKRRWRYRKDTHVGAPLTAVDDENGDTWVRAPFARSIAVVAGRGCGRPSSICGSRASGSAAGGA
jgi:hypothetical protein